MDTRTLIAIVLSVLVIVGFQLFTAQQQPPPAPPQPSAQDAKQETKQETRPETKKDEKARPVSPAPIAADTPSAEERQIKVSNNLYSAVLTSRGGTIARWEITGYKDKVGKDVVLLNKPGTIPALAMGSTSDMDLAAVNFSVKSGDLKLDSGNKSASVIFDYAQEGRSVRRTYTFYHDSYRVDLADEVSGLAEYWITLGSDFGIYERDDSYTHLGPVLLKGTELVEVKDKKMKEIATYKDDLKWIAQEDMYFCAALVPSTQVEEARAWYLKEAPIIALKAKPGVNKFTLYAGPKEHDRLAALNLGLEHIVDFGFFSIIARPLFWVLKFFYKYIGNYGWAIVLLTIVVRIPFIPILNIGQKSMKRLQELQPKMNEIKEKYKKDPQKMQAEMMELYKKYKVNPMSGCFPMLLQIPVFFALYKVLLVAIELRGAPWLLWIADLSAKDPYYVLPVVMGVTMLIQQKMTPSTMDPTQAKIMLLMPVVFTFMFLNFASGLVLYWLVNNLLAIIQQFYTNRQIAKQPKPA